MLARLREHREIDYSLMMDADDTITIDDRIGLAGFKVSMTADVYDVEIRHGSIKHHRPQILSNHLKFAYRGALHEFVALPEGPLNRGTATGFHISIVGGELAARTARNSNAMPRCWKPRLKRSRTLS